MSSPRTGPQSQLNVNVNQPYTVCVHMTCLAASGCNVNFNILFTDATIATVPAPASATPTPSLSSTVGASTPSPSPAPCQFSGVATIDGTVTTNGQQYAKFSPLGACDAGGWGTPQKGTFDIAILNPQGCQLSVVPTSGSFCSPPSGMSYGIVTQIPGSTPLLNTRSTGFELKKQPCDATSCCASVSSTDNSALCVISYTITFSPLASLAEVSAIVKWFLSQSYAIPVVAAGGALLLFLAVLRLCSSDTSQCMHRLFCCKHDEDDSCGSCLSCCCKMRSLTVRDVVSDSSEPLCAAGGCSNKAAGACPNNRCRGCCIAEGEIKCARHIGQKV